MVVRPELFASQPMRELAALPSGCTLGINYTCMHDAAIAVVGPDGKALFACALERITRTKQDGRWPTELLEQVPWDRIDAIVVGSLDNDAARLLGEQFRREDWPGRRKRTVDNLLPLPYPAEWGQRVASLPRRPLQYDHHHCHAASAYYLAGFDRALVLTCDAGAHQCPWHFAAYVAEGDRIDLLAGMHFRQYVSPAHLYTLVTALLGLIPNRHEGKVTGLAARAHVDRAMLDRFEAIAWPLAEEIGRLVHWDMCADVENAPTCIVNEAVRIKWRQAFAGFRDEDLAACAQRVLEDQVLRFVDHALALAGGAVTDVCLAGGVFSNVLLNQKVIARFRRGFVAPAMTDDGIALGGALLGHVQLHPEASPRRHRSTMYLGPTIHDAAALLTASGLTHEQPTEPAQVVAGHLAAGRTVAVARGPMEFGPRALGHRSLLAPAADVAINDWLNKRLQRTEYMPFAPILRREDAADLVADVARIGDAARFMTVTADCLQAMRQEAAATVHIDGTARPQIVDREDDEFSAQVLAEYARLTGRRALVNTSFNVHEQPIVCTAEDALLGFAQTRVDCLCLGDLLIARSGNEAMLEQIAGRDPAAGRRPGNVLRPLGLGRWINQLEDRVSQLSMQLLEAEEARTAQARRLEATELARAALEAELQRVLQDLNDRLSGSEHQRGEMALQMTNLESELHSIRSSLTWLESRRWVRLGRKLRVV